MYDQLIQGTNIHEKALLSKRAQKVLLKVMQRFMDATLSTWAIGFYLERADPVKRACFALMFAALSPVLPALEWATHKVKSHSADVLMLDPATDGLLLWFEMELIKNKLFLIETVFESCFQLVLQFVAVFVTESNEYDASYLSGSTLR